MFQARDRALREGGSGMKHDRLEAANTRVGKAVRVSVVAGLFALLAGCSGAGLGGASFGSFYDGNIQRGYVQDARQIDALKTGQSKEAVLATLGTPSTTSTVGGDAWYYISQSVSRPVAFMPDRITDQRVLAVYFGGGKMQRVSNYGLQDGRLFDYVTRTTPVAGGDSTFVQNMIRSLLKFS